MQLSKTNEESKWVTPSLALITVFWDPILSGANNYLFRGTMSIVVCARKLCKTKLLAYVFICVLKFGTKSRRFCLYSGYFGKQNALKNCYNFDRGHVKREKRKTY